MHQGFLEALKTQRWDDHRYYHHSRINQTLHLVSALSFLVAYVALFTNPFLSALIAWLVSMTSRQAGHFFFEPKGYDEVNQATHEHKEDIKVGYNLKRKVVLMSIWAAGPAILWLDPTLFGLWSAHPDGAEFVRRVGAIWLVVGLGGLVFRTVFTCSSCRACKRAWSGRRKSLPTRSTTCTSTTRRRSTCSAAS